MPNKLRSAKIVNQQNYNTCWAHAITRNFIRTFLILGIIPQKNENTENEQTRTKNIKANKNTVHNFYLLFYIILVYDTDCHIGNYAHINMFKLLNFIKNDVINETWEMFTYTYNDIYCEYMVDGVDIKTIHKNNLDRTIIDPKCVEEAKQNFRILFKNDNEFVYIAQTYYHIDYPEDNRPTLAIKHFLDLRLQPVVNIRINQFFDNITKNKSIQHNEPLICKNSGHYVNLRKWFNNSIEFKNSYGTTCGNGGNFTISNLKYFTCENKNSIHIITLCYDIEKIRTIATHQSASKMIKKFYETLENNIGRINPTIDPIFELNNLKTDNNFVGSYDSNGLYSSGILTHYNYSYEGEFKNGMYNGNGKEKCSNGDIYEGEFKDDLANGNGILTYDNGDVYKGEFKDNLPNGNGILTFYNGNIYKGEVKDGFCDGIGEMKYDNGDFYYGEWENGGRTGTGEMIYNDGDIYYGEWKNGIRTGMGEMKYDDGDIYDGEWKDGFHNGMGEMKYYNGNTYKGEWKDGFRDGIGEMKYDNGNTYKGEWKDGFRDGIGKLIYINDDIYDGEWKDDMVDGDGVVKFDNGNLLKGKWKNDDFISGKIILNDLNEYDINYENDNYYIIEQENDNYIYTLFDLQNEIYFSTLNNQGYIEFSNGNTYYGNWIKYPLYNSENNVTGTGKMKYANGDIYNGEWKNGLRDGIGKITYAFPTNNYKSYEGEWKDDIPNGKGDYELINNSVNKKYLIYKNKYLLAKRNL